jgi:hypothetical protein
VKGYTFPRRHGLEPEAWAHYDETADSCQVGALSVPSRSPWLADLLGRLTEQTKTQSSSKPAIVTRDALRSVAQAAGFVASTVDTLSAMYVSRP